MTAAAVIGAVWALAALALLAAWTLWLAPRRRNRNQDGDPR